MQVAEELKLDCVKLSLSQYDELGELVGYPVKEFEIQKDGEIKWIPESLFDMYLKDGYKPTGEKRMDHALPDWIQGKKENGILFLDDFSRCNPLFMQAIMELIHEQTYASWKLPKGWTIILSSNPEGGDYFVSSMDDAMKTRFINVNLKFDVKNWAEWAEHDMIDTRCINFALLHPEIFTTKTNARSLTNFYNAISSVNNFEDSLPLIKIIGEGSIGPEATTLFTIFISQKLDKLISPDQIIYEDNWESVRRSLISCVGKGDSKRMDISSLLATRIENYLIHVVSKKAVSEDIIKRVKEILKDEEIFTNDLKYKMTKNIINGDRIKFQKLLMDSEIMKITVK